MKLTLLMVLVVAFAVLRDAQSLFSMRRRRRNWVLKDGPDIAEFDTNLDGVLDQTELKKIMTTRDVQEFLDTSDNGAFEKLLRHLRYSEDDKAEN